MRAVSRERRGTSGAPFDTPPSAATQGEADTLVRQDERNGSGFETGFFNDPWQEGNNSIASVRGAFVEGEPVYEGAGFREKTHIQICVCNTFNIKGVFRVPEEQLL